jgi:AbiV family abortive infection protein
MPKIDADNLFFETIQRIINFGGMGYREAAASAGEGSKLFSQAAAHVIATIGCSFDLYSLGRFPPSAFMAITAIEEAARAELLIYVRKSEGETKGRPPLKFHVAKHVAGVRPTVFVGSFLPRLLGNEVCSRLLKEAQNGTLTRLREAALYFELSGTGLQVPAVIVNQRRSYELLALAVECADDILMGYTSETTALEAKLTEIKGLLEKTSYSDLPSA